MASAVEPLLLSLDTTGETYSLALSRGEKVLAECTSGQPRQHLVQIFPALELLARQSGAAVSALDGVVVTAGPGSFTGVRTGLLIARSLGQLLDIPLYPVDTLEALAAGVGDRSQVVAALDARKGEVFWAEFRVRGGWPERLSPARLAGLAEFRAALPEGAALVGGACALLPEDLPGMQPRENWRPRAGILARLGLRLARAGAGQPWSAVQPGYMRAADVQVQIQ